MSAGLPGFGLGGLFFILSALAAPIVELVRTARGESSLAAWAQVGRQFTLAVVMIVAVNATLQLADVLLGGDAAAPAAGPPGAGAGGATGGIDGAGTEVVALPLVPIAFTASLLALVIGAAKAMHLAQRLRVRLAARRSTAGLAEPRPGWVGDLVH